MKKNIKEMIQTLKDSQKIHLEIGLSIMNSGQRKMYMEDLFFLPMIQRSISIISGFCKELEDNNYLCAAPLVRLHLDTLLNTYAMFISKSPSDFALNKLKGKQTSKLKDKNGSLMTDGFLARALTNDTRFDADWASNLYKGTSKFIHVSDKHLLGIYEKALKDGQITMRIGESLDIPSDSKVKVLEAMSKITLCLLRLWQGWVETKKNIPTTKS